MSTTWLRFLFPAQPRSFHGERWVNIGLRCVHPVGVSGIAGGFLFDLEAQIWSAYWSLTLASGVALTLTPCLVDGIVAV
jgi:hypothetical protein